MNDADRAAYVRAALAVHGFPVDAAFVAAIDAQFALIARNAAPCLAVPVAVEDEPAPAFRPV